MYKFIITRRSANPKTGPILVTTSEKRTCPLVCPLRKESGGDTAGACYAEHGFIGTFLWRQMKQTKVHGTFKNGDIRVYNFADLLNEIRKLPEDALWRHNQAGDLPSKDQVTIDETMVRKLVEANKGRRGFTYTHFDVLKNRTNRRVIRQANKKGFTINLSANDIDHADQLSELNLAPVASIVPFDMQDNDVTPKGRKVVVCPATRKEGVNCKNCGLCYTQRSAIVGFPAHGHNKDKLLKVEVRAVDARPGGKIARA